MQAHVAHLKRLSARVAGALDEKQAEWARLDKARMRADGDQAQVPIDGLRDGYDDDR